MKKTILSFALSFVSLLVCAGNVTEQEALRKAQQFMQGRSFQQKNLRRAATANTFAQDAFYVFNADGNQGFVIVSADDRTEAILGYSDTFEPTPRECCRLVARLCPPDKVAWRGRQLGSPSSCPWYGESLDENSQMESGRTV